MRPFHAPAQAAVLRIVPLSCLPVPGSGTGLAQLSGALCTRPSAFGLLSDFGFRIFLMRRSLVQFSLKYRGIVVALACVVLGYGLYVASNAKLDVFPNFVQPQVVIQTECPGLSPEQVELLV